MLSKFTEKEDLGPSGKDMAYVVSELYMLIHFCIMDLKLPKNFSRIILKKKMKIRIIYKTYIYIYILLNRCFISI